MAPNTEIEPGRADIEEIQEIIKAFLSKYQYLYEKRIQKLVFYAEVYSIDNYYDYGDDDKCRLSDANWKPYLYGSFSKEVRKALRTLDLSTQSVYKNGNETTRYLNRHGTVEASELDRFKLAIIDRVHELTKNSSTEELAQFSKNHWLFDNTEYGNQMDFADYIRALQAGKVDPILQEEDSPNPADYTDRDMDDGVQNLRAA